MQYPLQRRRELLVVKVLPRLSDPVRFSPNLQAPLPDLIQSVKAQGFEGLVAKQLSSRYEPGLRSGAWMKMRINRGQEFVIGGYTPTLKNFDALVFGYYDQQGRLLYAARTRNGFTPSSREQLFRAFRSLAIKECPFANLQSPAAAAGVKDSPPPKCSNVVGYSLSSSPNLSTSNGRQTITCGTPSSLPSAMTNTPKTFAGNLDKLLPSSAGFPPRTPPFNSVALSPTFD